MSIRLYGPNEAAAELRISRSKFFELIASGEIRSVKIGRRRLVSEQALSEFITRLEAAQNPSGAA